MVGVLQSLLIQRGRQENGRGQAKRSKPDESPDDWHRETGDTGINTLAQRDRRHRDKYTGENNQHLEGVETITRTGETDQDVTGSALAELKR